MERNINGYKEKFIELFGECVEDDKKELQDFVVIASASRIEGIIELEKFYETHTPRETFYSIVPLPKIKDRKNQVIAFGNKFFPFERIKKIIENFFQYNVEVGLYHGRGASALVFKLDDDYGIMIANKVDKKKKDPNEILYTWDDLFFHKEFGDDMEL